MADRHTCWLRPLALYLDVEETGTAPVSVVDLRNGPDVICPSELVQPALDTEWLYLLGKMGDTKEPCNYAQANQHLRQFLQMLFSN
ncbi:MAG: hypothetical protein F6J95_019485 [Leptolyngbya sp. SIO1E4]|nr:hypothetical protein [Leptolyngbya sp. SIO1E4]